MMLRLQNTDFRSLLFLVFVHELSLPLAEIVAKELLTVATDLVMLDLSH